jgi:hypothetical protein
MMNPVTLFRNWRRRYTPQSAERYYGIAVYDYWGSYTLDDLLDMVPLLLMTSFLFKAAVIIARREKVMTND